MASPAVRIPRVLFAIGGLHTGGSERQLVELILRTHPHLIDATVLTWDPSGGSVHRARLLEVGVAHVSIGRLRAPRGLRPLLAQLRIARIIRAIRPDVIYAWLEQASVMLTPGAKACGIPMVVARRNVSGIALERFRSAAFLVRRAEQLAEIVTCNSNAVLEQARRRGIRAERLRIVRNGHTAAAPLPFPNHGPVVLGYVAQFRPEKGHLRLLEALSSVDTGVPWRIDLAGDGPLARVAKVQAERRGLGKRVNFIGPIDDTREFWRERSVAVLLSDHEGSPNALIEAALAGRPIVGTSVGGIPEVVAPKGGLLVRPGEPRAIASALEQLINDDTLRRKLGAGAHAQALERFSMERFVAGHVGALQEALGTRQLG